MNVEFPFDGEYISSSSKKHDEVVVFVHHFGGNKKTTRRHQKLVLDAGYDCVTFNLTFHSFSGVPLKERFFILMKYIFSFRGTFFANWYKEINQILNHIDGEKIIFSLSSPSASVAGVLGHSGRQDIKGWICDCGPFLDAWDCFWNYNVHEAKIRNPILLVIFNTIGYVLYGGIGYKSRMTRWVSNIPPHLPILSLRAENDLLVPPVSIQRLFSLSDHLNLRCHTFSHCGHLQGIKSHQAEYTKQVVSFLQGISKN